MCSAAGWKEFVHVAILSNPWKQSKNEEYKTHACQRCQNLIDGQAFFIPGISQVFTLCLNLNMDRVTYQDNFCIYDYETSRLIVGILFM